MNKKYENYARYLIYLVSLFISTFGIALSVKANLGTSIVVCIPNVLSIAYPYVSIGMYSIFFNILLVVLQIALLGSRFDKLQLLQVVIAIIYGYFIDFSLYLLTPVNPFNYVTRWIFCICGALILAFGVFIQLKSHLIYLPIDGFVLTIAHIVGSTYSHIKPFNDILVIIISVVISLYATGGLVGVREGTVFAALAVGPMTGFYRKIFADK